MSENLAKFFYDIAKLTFGTGVLTGIIKGDIIAAALSLFFTGITVYIALEIEKKGAGDE